jgi:diaminopimelate decarboxylase
MKSFAYKNNVLGVETQNGWRDLRDIAKEQSGPFYLYSRRSIEQRAQIFIDSLQGLDFKIHYAVKANGNEEVLKILKNKNCGADVVSRGEAQWALDNGFSPKDIIFSGVAKSKEDLRFAIDKELYQINVESLPELQRLGEVAQDLKKTAAVGIRINPNIKVDTHPYITTGFRENKFGIAEYQMKEALEIIKSFSSHLRLQGLSSHIGSQIRELSPLRDAVASLLRTTNALIQEGHKISTIDLGGGIGINYSIDDESVELEMMKSFCSTVKESLKDFKGRVMMEPGRALVGRSGILCAQVEYIKYNGYKDFIILNSGMNHLMRPSLYQAFHRILPLEIRTSATEKIFDVVGPICESSDVLGHNRQLHEPQEGDWLAVMDAGAYGMSMASFYNRHEFPAEVVV